jgi:AcrR family transcriptional regulator
MEDRRIKKTEKAVQAAFAKLLSEKSVEEITVKKLCETADINKSTFYLHYRDIYDCADRLRDTIVEDFCDVITPYRFEELIENFSTVLNDLKNLCDKNREIYTPFLKSPGLAFSSCKIRQLVIAKFLEKAKVQGGIDETFSCSVSFVISGMISLLEQYEVPQINIKTILTLTEKIQHGFANGATVY